MRVALTGATGFLGQHLIRALHDHDVVAISRNPGPSGVAADITLPNSLDSAFEGCDVVIHAAGLVDHHPSSASKTWSVHVDGTKNVINACRKAGVRRLVHVSSSGTIAVSEGPKALSETSGSPLLLIREWPYYRSKHCAEQLALAANDDSLQVVSINPSLLLGPGDPDGHATEAVRWFLQGRLPLAPSGGLSFADVRDVAYTTAAMLQLGTPGQRYLVGAANWHFPDFYSRLARLSGRPAIPSTPRIATRLLRWIPDLGRDGFLTGYPLTRADADLSAHFWWLDDTLARTDLNWAPRDPLNTLSDTITDLQQRGLA